MKRRTHSQKSKVTGLPRRGASAAARNRMRPWRSGLAALGVAGALFLGQRAALADTHGAESEERVEGPTDFAVYVPGAETLEGRIIAPCCWIQTIDVHGSPAASALRKQIRERLTAGESAEAIERSLVAEYGPRILAEPAGGPLKGVGLVLSLLMLGGGAGAVLLLRRWRKAARTDVEAPGTAGGGGHTELNQRLDAELALLDRE